MNQFPKAFTVNPRFCATRVEGLRDVRGENVKELDSPIPLFSPLISLFSLFVSNISNSSGGHLA